jgi:hypothetical protein
MIEGDPHEYPEESGWTVVQRGRYRYTVTQANGGIVRVVLSEYLAAEVAW